MNLVEEYLALVSAVVSYRETVYDGATANDHNRKVRKMRAIATEIEKNSPALKYDFFGLLSNESNEIRLWIAHHILEVMNYDKPCRKVAFQVIRHKARTDKTASGFGEKVWLKQWYKTHPKDRWI